MNEPLSTQDINTLIEALDSWEHKDAMEELAATIAEKMVPIDKLGAASREFADGRKKRAADKVVRKERSIMLKAKLLRIRDGQSADALMADGKVHS